MELFRASSSYFRRECSNRYTRLNSDIPSIVPVVLDQDGDPIVDVQVQMDGEQHLSCFEWFSRHREVSHRARPTQPHDLGHDGLRTWVTIPDLIRACGAAIIPAGEPR